ncbi:MAG: hypothetical protein OXG38_12345 [Chloroflexi bacterium]|nr:hypothetical protein [Chloroflexota bacterium]
MHTFGLSMKVVDVDRLATRAERIELGALAHPLDALLVIALDLLDTRRLRQLPRATRHCST